MTPILALDLATSTGWALRDRAGRVTSGVQRFELKRGESPGMRFLRFRRWLLEIGELADLSPGDPPHQAPGVIAYETPLSAGPGMRSGIAKELAALVLVEAAAAGVETTCIAPSSLKKHATGSGRASKDDMTLAATKRWAGQEWLSGDALEDQCDALCVLAWCLEEIGEA